MRVHDNCGASNLRYLHQLPSRRSRIRLAFDWLQQIALLVEHVEFGRRRNVDDIANRQDIADACGALDPSSASHALDGPFGSVLEELDCLPSLLDRSVRITGRLKTDDSLVFRRLQDNPKPPRFNIGKTGHFGEFGGPFAAGDVDLGNRPRQPPCFLSKATSPARRAARAINCRLGSRVERTE